MTTRFFRLLCPRCKPTPTILIREERFGASHHPLRFIVCKACGWGKSEDGEDGGLEQATKAGQEVYDAAMAEDRAEEKATADAATAAREAETRRQLIATAEQVLREWVGQPVAERIYNSGAGWKVQVPTLDGVALDDLDAAVVSLYHTGIAEAETEADRRTKDDEAQRPARAAATAAAEAAQIREDAAVARQRRQDASDLF